MKTILSRSLMALAITAFFGNTYAAELEEIIVTAQKRAESLQDVPISMSALDGQKLEEVGIHSFQELTAYVPNLSITENAVNTIIGMRGVGIGANQSFEQSVGFMLMASIMEKVVKLGPDYLIYNKWRSLGDHRVFYLVKIRLLAQSTSHLLHHRLARRWAAKSR